MRTIPSSSWLFLDEQAWIVEQLLRFGLIKFDNQRKLPLKSGGMTDVYINLRDARNNPEAISFIANLFADPLRRLGLDRFVEVPDSVSCFAGPLSISMGIPYLTIRGQAKKGRVSDAKVIGSARKGDRIVIMDDVITDGASKITPIQKCIELGLNTEGLVVLVDRQQGWRKLLSDQGIQLPVWAGMTLDDVRRHLIQTLGVMQRCDPEMEKKNPIIVALDGRNWETILPIIDPLRTTGCILKVNDLLFDQGIEHLLPRLATYGQVMADLKLHDISNTVGNIVKRLLACPPWAVTVHGSGGKNMIEAAVNVLKPVGTKVLVVTVLTSIDKRTCKEICTRLPAEQVAKLAAIANRAGADGLVCSPEEVADLKAKYPRMLLVTPGIRSIGEDAGDQKRIGTPEQAIANGSDYLVMGRQILGKEDPVAEVHRLLTDELMVDISF